MDSPILEVNHLHISFKVGGTQLSAVEDVNFVLGPGRTLGIVGESGCGKSVTASSIMRLLPKNAVIDENSEILFEGRNLAALSQNEMCDIRGAKIAMIFQDPMTALNPVYTIGSQLIEMIRAHNKKVSKKEAFEKGVEMLEKVGIPLPRQRMKEYPHQLSGGMRQRVMIAMALSTDAKLLIADEPTTALDVTIQAQILELIDKLKNEFQTSVILITHDMGVVSDVADDVLIMYAGETVEHGNVKEIFRHPLHPYTFGLLRSIPRLNEDVDTLYTIRGTVPALSDMPSGCRFSTRCDECMEQCRTQRPPLIDLNGHSVRCWKFAEKGDAVHGEE